MVTLEGDKGETLFKNRTILIVDDDPSNVQALAQIIAPTARVVFALNGNSALEVARTTVPDLILLDVEMPGMDGFDVCSMLSRTPLLSEVPVIFVTGRNDVESEIAGLEAGAVDFISKPFVPQLVTARVRTHLRVRLLTQTLQHAARTDALTGLSNRRHFDEFLHREWDRALRNRLPLSLLLIDIDHFKNFNDLYGHPAGDNCLRRVADVLGSAIRRPADLMARYGGEEFAMLLPETDRSGACHIAEVLIEKVNALQITHEASPSGAHVSVSVGVSTFDEPDIAIDDLQPTDSNGSGASLVAFADSALYDAKAHGRHCWRYRRCELLTVESEE
jgi:diguanylate cyclase (GGDEF)-like protein